MKIKFSIVGCGHIGNRHAQRILENDQATLIGAYDIKTDKLNEFSEKHKCAAAASLDELLSLEADIVCICTPSGLHSEHAIEGLNSGKHVLVEKPMSLSVAEGEAMQAAAKDNNRLLLVVKQNRYNPPVQRIKDALDSGQLGSVFQVSVNCFWNRNDKYYRESDWKGSKQLDGGVLFNQFSHFIDILYYLFGAIQDVNGHIDNFNHQQVTEFEDSGSFSFRFKQGGIGSINFTTNSFQSNMEGSITIFAEKGTVKIGGKYLNAIEYLKADEVNGDQLPVSAPANNYGYYEGSMSNHDLVIENVVQVLQGNEEIMTPAQDGIEVVRMIEQLYNAAKNN